VEPVRDALRIPKAVVHDPDEIGPRQVEARCSMDVALKPIRLVLGGRLPRDDAD